MIKSLLSVFLVALLAVADSQRQCSNAACPAVYTPICADCNGELKTFSNSCELKVHNRCNYARCIYRSRGECTTECHVPCPLNYLPVCSWNGRLYKTFPNECARNAFNTCYNDVYDTIANCACEQGGKSRSC